MRSYAMKKVAAAPDWSAIPVMPMDHHLWGEPLDISAQTQICWGENALYIRQTAVEKYIRMEESGPMAPVCDDSCLEFFFRPTERMDYFNIEINPNRAIFLGFGTCLEDLIRLQLRNVQELFQIQTQMTEDGWELTYQIPFAFIRRFFPEFQAKEGSHIYANAYKCGDKTVKDHYLAWTPIEWFEPAFHRPEQFGCLIFGGK